MIRKKLILVCSLIVLTIGGFVFFNNPRDKQLAYLKEHEKEIISWVKSKYPQIESVELDWDTFEIGPRSNGIMVTSYILSVQGMFNNQKNTKLSVDFRLETRDEIPDVKKIGMLDHPKILKNDVWWIYE